MGQPHKVNEKRLPKACGFGSLFPVMNFLQKGFIALKLQPEALFLFEVFFYFVRSNDFFLEGISAGFG